MDFISSAEGIARGEAYERSRLRQLQPVESQLPPEIITFDIPQPKGAEVYYDSCATIDQHNRCRQWDLGLERTFRTKRWDLRVGMSIFGMMVVDAFKVFKLCTNSDMPQSTFYEKLASQLIDNGYVERNGSAIKTRGTSVRSVEDGDYAIGTSGVGLHLTPLRHYTKKRAADGSVKVRRMQINCRKCHR